MLQRLCEGVLNRSAIDDPQFSMKQMFMQLTLAFNNEDVVITMPDAANDLENIELLNPNDENRITIQRDGKLLLIK